MRTGRPKRPLVLTEEERGRLETLGGSKGTVLSVPFFNKLLERKPPRKLNDARRVGGRRLSEQ
jgi:hypothetical protein